MQKSKHTPGRNSNLPCSNPSSLWFTTGGAVAVITGTNTMIIEVVSCYIPTYHRDDIPTYIIYGGYSSNYTQ
jgi:hypothetical protein